MSRRLAVLLGAVCLLLLGLGSAVATGHGGGGHKGDHHPGDDGRSLALFADLNGRNEISTTTGQPGAGDPDGFGSASFTFDGGQVCFGITVGNLDTPAAAHIHRGPKGENGPIVVTLTAPTAGDPGASSGCVPVDAALAADIQAHPRAFYTNVHTAAFANGAVRGQLKRLGHHHEDDD
jgi:CHRD domain-containing protein